MKNKAVLEFKWSGKLVSVNNWTRVRIVKGKPVPYKTGKYKEMIRLIQKNILPGPQEIETVDVSIKVTMWKMKDTDNVIKPILDAIQQSGRIKNDRQVRNLFIYREYNGRDEDDEIQVRLTRND